MFSVLRQLLSFLDKRSRIQLYALTLPVILASMLEMMSVGMIVPLTQAVMGNGLEEYRSWLPPSVLNLDSNDMKIALAVGFVFVFVAKNFVVFTVLFLVTDFTQKKQAEFLQRMYDLYLRRSYTFYLQRNSAEILRNLVSSAGASFDGLRLALNMTMDLFLAATACAVLVILEPTITLGVGITLLAAMLIFYRLLHPFVQRWGAYIFSIEADMIKSINQSLGAIKDIKITNCQPVLYKKFKSLTDRHAAYATRTIAANQSPRIAVETFVIVGFMVVVGILFTTKASIIDIASTIGLFSMAALRLMPAASRILSAATELKHRTAMVSTLFNDLQDGLRDIATKNDDVAVRPVKFTQSISFQDVSYSYPKSAGAAITAINLQIRKGETVGLVGESGSGKTTIANILLGLLEPTTGKLMIDGQDVTRNIRGWQADVGHVPQEIYILDDTLRRNVAFGVADENIDDNVVIDSLRTAQLNDFLIGLPEGLDTMLGERGLRFSGGQRQRVGIARSLYKKPEVLVLDEATSALDSETEHALSDAVVSLAGKKTMIIIAHRLSTVEKCDRVCIMGNGQILDSGTFSELLSRSAPFRQMVNRQRGIGRLAKT